MQAPTVGRIVHFNNSGKLEAALVVAVHNETSVTLAIWNDQGSSRTSHNVSLGTEPGTWCWPARA